MFGSSVTRRVVPAILACAVMVVLAACGGPAARGGASGRVIVDGSSTVAPLSAAAAELFRLQNPTARVTVATSGTGGGFAKFCSGQTDISNASRPISAEEKAACRRAGIEYTALHIANDALTVVVNEANTWADCLTTEQLRTIWAPESDGKITNWKQVDPSFPDVPLALFGPGTDSGTFDYFTEVIVGEEGASRTDYSASENDNVLVQGVQGAKGATAYFGFTYAEQNRDVLKPVKIDSGQGCVAPSPKTVQNGSYEPLARPLFIYVNNQAYRQNPAVRAFVDFYAANSERIAKAAQFISLNQQQKSELKATVASIGSRR